MLMLAVERIAVHRGSTSWPCKEAMCHVQMGGPAGVQESENVAITLAPSKGLFMHAESRQAA